MFKWLTFADHHHGLDQKNHLDQHVWCYPEYNDHHEQDDQDDQDDGDGVVGDIDCFLCPPARDGMGWRRNRGGGGAHGMFTACM